MNGQESPLELGKACLRGRERFSVRNPSFGHDALFSASFEELAKQTTTLLRVARNAVEMFAREEQFKAMSTSDQMSRDATTRKITTFRTQSHRLSAANVSF